jgi:L-threonylcarbamoyladenylate synthase
MSNDKNCGLFMNTSTPTSSGSFTSSDLETALSSLRNGEIILFPTDTLWSVGCDATMPDTVRRLLELAKSTDGTKAEVLVHALPELKELIPHLHPRLETLLHFHQRPLAILVDGKGCLPDEALRPDGEVAVRIVQDPFSNELIKAFGRPVFSQFAAVEGSTPPGSFGSISSEIIQGCRYVVRHRQADRTPGEPAVMVRFCEHSDELEFLRE